MHLERSTTTTLKSNVIGLQELIDRTVGDVTGYYYSQQRHLHPYVSVIKGKIGSGKTAFMKNVLAELEQV